MQLLILRTNIKSKKKVRSVKLLFNGQPAISNWSIDTEDIDRVLRIEADDTINENDIIQLVTKGGFLCESLPD